MKDSSENLSEFKLLLAFVEMKFATLMSPHVN